MASPLDPKELVTLEELTISNMWEVAALIEVLEKKGVLTKQNILTEIRELRQMNLTAKTPRELDDPREFQKGFLIKLQSTKDPIGPYGTKYPFLRSIY